jgi:hypothetical protein
VHGTVPQPRRTCLQRGPRDDGEHPLDPTRETHPKWLLPIEDYDLNGLKEEGVRLVEPALVIDLDADKVMLAGRARDVRLASGDLVSSGAEATEECRGLLEADYVLAEGEGVSL